MKVCVYVCMYVFMYIRMHGYMYTWLAGWMDGWMGGGVRSLFWVAADLGRLACVSRVHLPSYLC